MKKELTCMLAGVACAVATQTPVEAGNINLGGDLQTRLQFVDNGSTKATTSVVRFHLGGSAQLDSKTNVNFGLASGPADARSINQELNNTFQSTTPRLDYVYATRQVRENVKLSVGQMKNPLWRASDLLIDDDVRPSGIAVNHKNPFQLGVDVNVGLFTLESSNANSDDPNLLAVQAVRSQKVNDRINAKASATYYSFNNVKGKSLTGSAGTNTNTGGNLSADFTPISLTAQVDVANVIVPLHRFVFEYTTNSGADKDSDKTGMLAGVTLGDNDLSAKGNWQLGVNYRKLESDAFIDALTDSDSYNGKTGIEGIEVSLTKACSAKSSASLNYFSANLDSGTDTMPQNSLYVNMNFKF